MALANKVLFVAGPADVVDEEDAMARLSKGDDSIVPSLKQQDENLDGKHGATVLAIWMHRAAKSCPKPSSTAHPCRTAWQLRKARFLSARWMGRSYA